MEKDLEFLDMVGQAALVRDGTVSQTELVEAAIARAETRNEALNAIVRRLRRHCRKAPCAACRFCSRTLAANLPALR